MQELSELKSGTLHRFTNAESFFLPQVSGQPTAYLRSSFPSAAPPASQQRNWDIFDNLYFHIADYCLDELICPSISYREAFDLPDIEFLRLP